MWWPFFQIVKKFICLIRRGLLQAILTGKGVGISLSTTITDQFYLDSKQIVGLPLLHDGKETQIYFKLLHRRKELLTAAEEKLLPMIFAIL